MGQKLTVVIPCKDERWNIRPCIESARLVADEILVADSGSTDGTLEIVRELGCRTIHREYRNSGDFKNWAIPQASHQWVMVLDADERITTELAEEIKSLLARAPEQDGYWIYRLNHFMGYPVRHGPWGADKVLRLFRRDLGRYVGDTDHAEVAVRGGRVGRLRARLPHYTFWTYDQYLRKIERYSVYQSQRWHEEGRPPRPAKMLLTAPFRFLHTYLLRLGCLDGLVGFQVCMLIAFYSFLKQGRLWELHYGKPQPNPEADSGNAAGMPRVSRAA